LSGGPLLKYSKAIEERLESIRSGTPTKNTKKKRRFSRGILLADIILIIAIFFYFNSREDETSLSNGSVVIDGVNYRISSLVNKDDMIITVSLSSREKKQILFENPVANIVVSYKGVTVLKEYCGIGIESVELESDEARNFFVKVPVSKISDEMKKRGIETEPVKRSFFNKKQGQKFLIRGYFLNSERVELEIVTEVNLKHE